MARDGALHVLFERGRAAWPQVALPFGAFSEHARSHHADRETVSDAAGLYLACACARGDARALAAFERDLMPTARAAVVKVNAAPAFVDEAMQRIRHHLLVAAPESDRPRIQAYSGRGPLAGWVRVVASRLAIDLRREQAREQSLDSDALLAADPGALDPAFLLLGARYAGVFRSAVVAALRALSSRQRALLDLAYVKGLSGEDLGKLYGVNRSTIARWLADAREAVYGATASRVKQELDCDTNEVASLLNVLHSGFDDTLVDLLVSMPEPS